MNWTMGRYIDGLDDEARDRLITAERFNDGRWWGGEGECGCLVGTACGGHPFYSSVRKDDAEWGRYLECDSEMLKWGNAPASLRFPKAVDRFGKPRVVRAIKLRAASGLTSRVVERVETETVNHG